MLEYGKPKLKTCAVCFGQAVENGVPAHVCDPATPHHAGNAVHCDHGEGSILI